MRRAAGVDEGGRVAAELVRACCYRIVRPPVLQRVGAVQEAGHAHATGSARWRPILELLLDSSADGLSLLRRQRVQDLLHHWTQGRA